ncbi:MAG: hypothetical protein WCT23_06280 [Candidatus Neomarinimicrobiota bacterium]|jgi:hypothetical protein
MKRCFLKYFLLFLTLGSTILPAQNALVLIIENDSLAVKDQDALEEKIDDHLLQYANAGYPYINLQFNAYEKQNNTEYFHYRIDKGEKVRIDTIVFGDYSPREIALLSRYINLPEDGYFHYSQVQLTIADLKSNPLLRVEEKADIYDKGLRLYTEAKQNIRFDAMAAYKEEREQKGIVGNIDMSLINLGGLGRTATFHWTRPTLSANTIDLSYTEPYILNRPFSMSGAFSQRYEDSSYVKRDLDLSFIYHVNNRSTFTINYINEYIGSSQDGSDSLFVKQKRSATKAGFNYYSKPGMIRAKVLASSSLHFGSKSRISKNDIYAEIIYRGTYIGINCKLLGALAVSEDIIANYDHYKLGGARFLRAAYFEQYLTPAYFGWSLESGYFRDLDIYLFYDGALIQGIEKTVHHFGFGISVPAGNNKLTLALGIDSQEGFSGAKFHVSWNMP